MSRPIAWPKTIIKIALSAMCLHAHASTLSDLFANAKTVDETYLSAIANFEANQEAVAQAVAPLLPNISASAQTMSNRLNKNEGAGSLPEQNYKSNSRTLALRQAIIRPAAWLQLKQASVQTKGAHYELIRAENDLATRVASAYLDILYAEAQLQAIDAQIEALSTQVKASLLGFQQGYATRVDIVDAQSRLEQAKVDQQQVRSAKIFALEQLRIFTGNTPTSPFKATEKNNFRPQIQTQLAEWLERASERNADILIGQYRLEAVNQEVLKSYTGHLPTLDFVAQISNSNNENIQFPATTFTNRQIGLQVNVPLFSGGSVLSSSRQAAAMAQKEERSLNASISNIRLQVTKEYNNFNDGMERVKASQTTLAAAQEVLTSMRKNQAAGYKTQIDVLNALQRATASEKDLALAQYQCLLGLLKLNLLSGESADQAILEIEKILRN